MPIEKFRVLETWEATLVNWSRKLEYLFVNLNDDNVGTYTPGTDSIKDYMIDFGLGLQQVSANNVPISDSTGYYASTSVEGALAEVAGHLTSLQASTVSINDTGGYYTSANVEGALAEVAQQLTSLQASTVTVNDTGGYFSSSNVEGAMQEVGSRLYGYLDVSATTGGGPQTYNLPAPFTGKRQAIYCSAANSSDNAIAYTGSTDIFIGPGAMLRLNFTEGGQAVDLIGVSTARWGVLSLGSTAVTIVLPTLTT